MNVESPFDKARPRLVIETHNGVVSQPFDTDESLQHYIEMLVSYIPQDSTWWVER